MGHAQRSVIMQAYSASHGALYEPRAALHRLLDDAYIADDVLVHMIRLPVDTLCIVPDPTWSGRKSGIGNSFSHSNVPAASIAMATAPKLTIHALRRAACN